MPSLQNLTSHAKHKNLLSNLSGVEGECTGLPVFCLATSRRKKTKMASRPLKRLMGIRPYPQGCRTFVRLPTSFSLTLLRACEKPFKKPFRDLARNQTMPQSGRGDMYRLLCGLRSKTLMEYNLAFRCLHAYMLTCLHVHTELSPILWFSGSGVDLVFNLQRPSSK
jgi:hypothetical protein